MGAGWVVGGENSGSRDGRRVGTGVAETKSVSRRRGEYLDDRGSLSTASSGAGGSGGAATGGGQHPGVAATGRVGHTPGWQCRAWECSQRLPVKPAGQMHT